MALLLTACVAASAQEWPRPLPEVNVSSAAASVGSLPRLGSGPLPDDFQPTQNGSGFHLGGGSISETALVATPPATLIEPILRQSEADGWDWQLLPEGLIYRSYLAGVRESRIGCAWAHERDAGWIWDIALGGRVGLLRYGADTSPRPEGWQLDIEGAGFPRLDMEHEQDLVATDFRFGIPVTYGCGRFQTKLAFYHLSSHLGDEFMVRHPTVSRINYSRHVLVWGNSFYWTDDLRLYVEAAWAYYSACSDPWEFQFGVDYSPAGPSRFRGAPFVAVNAHLREEVDFGGNLVVQAGWQWRGDSPAGLMRVGIQYFAGMSEQYEFYDRYEEKVGLALWYDY